LYGVVSVDVLLCISGAARKKEHLYHSWIMCLMWYAVFLQLLVLAFNNDEELHVYSFTLVFCFVNNVCTSDFYGFAASLLVGLFDV